MLILVIEYVNTLFFDVLNLGHSLHYINNSKVVNFLNKKKMILRKAGFVGFILIMISSLTYGQKIDPEFREKLEEAKKIDGTEFFEDGKIKVKVNVKMIQQFYDSYDNHEYLSWRELIDSYDKESLIAFWNTYRTADIEENTLAEIKKELDEKYNVIKDKRIDQKMVTKLRK